MSPAKSKAQQQAMGAAYAAKKSGKIPPGKGPAAQMAKTMTKTQLKDFASTPRKNLPNRAKAPMRGGLKME